MTEQLKRSSEKSAIRIEKELKKVGKRIEGVERGMAKLTEVGLEGGDSASVSVSSNDPLRKRVPGTDHPSESDFVAIHEAWKRCRFPLPPLSAERSPYFSVIVPVHNRADLVDQALSSLQLQTLPSWEAIVVDDGSTDETARVLARWQESEPRVRVVTQPMQGGAGAARNQGLAHASGEVIAFLDSDNTFAPEFLEDAAWWFRTDDTLKAAYAAQLISETHGVKLSWPSYDAAALQRQNFIDLNVFLHRKEVRAEFDATLERLIDWDYILKISDQAAVRALPIMGGSYGTQARPRPNHLQASAGTILVRRAQPSAGASRCRSAGAVGALALSATFRILHPLRLGRRP